MRIEFYCDDHGLYATDPGLAGIDKIPACPGCMRIEAEAAKEEAIERVTRNTDPRWATLAYLAVTRVAKERERFTATDVWLVIEARPHEPRALAGILRRAARNGLIEATNEYWPSGMRVSHNRPMRVWRSRIHTRAICDALEAARGDKTEGR